MFKRLYDEMAEPKYVVAVGAGDIWRLFEESDNVVGVLAMVCGCLDPWINLRPEAILYGMMQFSEGRSF